MTVGAKILAAGIGSVVIVALVGIWIQRSVIRNQGIEAERVAMSAAIAQAESTRESIAKLNTVNAFKTAELLAEAKKATNLEDTTIYGTIPVVAAWKSLQELADQRGYEFRVPKNQARNSKNNPTPEEAEILRLLESGREKEYFRIDETANKIIYAKPIILSQDCLTCHGDPADSLTKDGRDPLGFTMENWHTGEVHGAFVLTQSLAPIDAVVKAGTWQTVKWTLPLVGLIGVAFFLLNHYGIVKPLIRPINEAITKLHASASDAANASRQLATTSGTIAQGATEQAASLEETSAALQEISSMVQRNAENANSTKSIASQTTQKARQSNDAMVRMSSAITEIEQSAAQTSKIIKVIDEIAFQTNLLALNAAVEAARAGEAGKGFAVVADEVRALALRSAEAASNTSSLIEGSLTSSRRGVEIVKEVGASLAEINTSAAAMNETVTEIAAACNEQATGLAHLNTALQQMSTVTQQNAASAEESASMGEHLCSSASQVQTVVDSLATIVGRGNTELSKAA